MKDSANKGVFARLMIWRVLGEHDYLTADEILNFLSSDHSFHTTKKTVQQRLCELYEEGLVGRLMKGVYFQRRPD